jgi:hypothetical protein
VPLAVLLISFLAYCTITKLFEVSTRTDPVPEYLTDRGRVVLFTSEGQLRAQQHKWSKGGALFGLDCDNNYLVTIQA